MLEIGSKSMKFADFSEIPENTERKNVQIFENPRKKFLFKTLQKFASKLCMVPPRLPRQPTLITKLNAK